MVGGLKGIFKILLTGMAVSFAGALPFGVLNVTAFTLSRAEGIGAALLFAFGVVLVEIIYLRLTLFGNQWLFSQQQLINTLQWVSVFVFVLMSLNSFLNFFWGGSLSAGSMTNSYGNSFIAGVFLSAINPIQIPFWLGWNTLLFSKGILRSDKYSYSSYLVGAGLGTLMGMMVFIIGGQLTTQLPLNNAWLHLAIGGIYLVCAILQMLKLWRVKPAIV